MRTILPALRSHLDSGTTTLCQCWRLTTASGEMLGFTDHDRPLTFDGTIFEAQSGFTASEIQSSLGLNVDDMEASGALESSRLDERRLKAGDFDNAMIEIWQANWQDPAQRLLVRKGHIGEVTYGQGAFTAEVRGLSHLLNQTQGRLYQFSCDAELGDVRCGVNLEVPALKGAGIVTAIASSRLDASGLAAFADGWFTHGKMVFTSGANAGRIFRIKNHRKAGAMAQLDLMQELPEPAAVGDQFTVTAGCDRQAATCQAKFANIGNFRGFPHMPGDDFVIQVASAEDPGNDGRKRG